MDALLHQSRICPVREFWASGFFTHSWWHEHWSQGMAGLGRGGRGRTGGVQSMMG